MRTIFILNVLNFYGIDILWISLYIEIMFVKIKSFFGTETYFGTKTKTYWTCYMFSECAHIMAITDNLERRKNHSRRQNWLEYVSSINILKINQFWPSSFFVFFVQAPRTITYNTPNVIDRLHKTLIVSLMLP